MSNSFFFWFYNMMLCFATAQSPIMCKNSRLPFGKRELQLDINLDGQVLPLIAAQVLAVGLSILQSFLVTDGKIEVLWQYTVPKPASVQTLAFTHRYGIKIFSSMFQYYCPLCSPVCTSVFCRCERRHFQRCARRYYLCLNGLLCGQILCKYR